MMMTEKSKICHDDDWKDQHFSWWWLRRATFIIIKAEKSNICHDGWKEQHLSWWWLKKTTFVMMLAEKSNICHDDGWKWQHLSWWWLKRATFVMMTAENGNIFYDDVGWETTTNSASAPSSKSSTTQFDIWYISVRRCKTTLHYFALMFIGLYQLIFPIPWRGAEITYNFLQICVIQWRSHGINYNSCN